MTQASHTIRIDHTAKHIEQFRRSVDLVEYHELGSLCPQEGVGIVEAAPVGRSLQVEVDRSTWPVRRDGMRQRRLAYLAWSQEYNRRRGTQALTNL